MGDNTRPSRSPISCCPTSRISPLLPILLLLLHLAHTISAQREQRIEKKLCIPFGFTILTESSFGRNSRCPCFFRGYAFTTLRHTDVRFSLYAVPRDDFEKWLIDVRADDTTPPPTRNSVVIESNKLTKYDPKIGKYVWYSGTRSVNKTGNFVLFSLTSTGKDSVCVTVGLILEPKPTICPLRLADSDPSPSIAANSTATYVVGGTRVDIDEFASYNALVRTSAGNCTASLIAEDWILTAAHCSVKPGAPVLVGGTDTSSGERHTVRAAFQHPDFFNGRALGTVELVNDIALAQLSEPVRNARPIPINSNTRGPAPGTIVRATGYGKRTTYTTSTHLHMVDNVVLSQRECQARFIAVRRDGVARGLNAKLHLCTGRDDDCEEGGVCFGDSGGPIVARTRGGGLVQIGITSYGDVNCGVQQLPDVFVRVSHFVPWVKRVTGGKAKVAAWASIDNNGDPASAGVDDRTKGDSTAVVPVWAVALAAAFGGFLAIALVLIGITKVVQRRRDAASGDRQTGGGGHGARTMSAPREIALPTHTPPPPQAPPPPIVPPPLGSRPVQ